MANTNPQLAKVLKEVMKGGKYAIGAKETITSMKGAKAVLCTRSVPSSLGSKVRGEAKKHGVPVIDLEISSAELARMVGRPYRVSTMSLRSVGEADLKQLLK